MMSIEYLLLSLISPLLDPGNLIMIALGSIIGLICIEFPSTGSKPQEKIEGAMPQANVNDLEMVKALPVPDDVFMALPYNGVSPDTASVVNVGTASVVNVGEESVQPSARMNGR